MEETAREGGGGGVGGCGGIGWVERARRACTARAQYIRVITICRGSRDQYQPEVGSANANNPYCWCLHSTASRDRIHLVSKFRIASSLRPPTDLLYLPASVLHSVSWNFFPRNVLHRGSLLKLFDVGLR